MIFAPHRRDETIARESILVFRAFLAILARRARRKRRAPARPHLREVA